MLKYISNKQEKKKEADQIEISKRAKKIKEWENAAAAGTGRDVVSFSIRQHISRHFTIERVLLLLFFFLRERNNHNNICIRRLVVWRALIESGLRPVSFDL